MKLRRYIPWALLAACLLLIICGAAWDHLEEWKEQALLLERAAAVRTMVYEDLPVSQTELTDAPGFTVSVENIDEEARTVTIRLKNAGEWEYTYGEGILLRAAADGAWRELPFFHENTVFRSVAYCLSAGQSCTEVIDWGWLYGPLQSGHYQVFLNVHGNIAVPPNRLKYKGGITTNCADYWVGAEFDITE